MAHEYRHRRRVEFADTDMAGIVHFAAYFRYAEEAEHAFLRSLGLSVHSDVGAHSIGFPRLAARAEYLKPLRFEEEVEVHIWVRQKGTRSIKYQFTITGGAGMAARGEISVVCCETGSDRSLRAVAIPLELGAQLDEAPYPALEFRE